MTSEMIMLRPMRRTDFPALEELVRQAWYADDESDDNGNVPNDERGLREYKLRKAIRLRNMHRLAAIDMHDFLSRTTEATVAERDGRVLGVVLGSLRSRVTTAQRMSCYYAKLLGVALVGKQGWSSRTCRSDCDFAGR